MATTGLVLTMLPATAMFAQDGPETGVTVTIGVESSLRVNDNYAFEISPAGATTLLDNTLTFGIVNITPIQSFSLNAVGVARFQNLPNAGSDVSLDDPDVSLQYRREGAFASFSGDARINREQLNFTDPLRIIEDPDETDLVIDNGTRENRSIGFTLDLNTAGPFGLEISVGHSAIEYSDTTDARLFDSETNRASITAKLRLSQVIEGRLRFGLKDYTASDAGMTERRTKDTSVGITYSINPVWELDAEIGDSIIATTVGATGLVTESEDTTGSLGVTRIFRTGSASLVFDQTASISGTRSSLSLSRSYETPSNMFMFSIGATRGPSDSTDLIGSLLAEYQLPSGDLAASFSQSFATSTVGNDFRTTKAGLNYSTDLSSTSKFGLGLNYARTSDAGDGSIEQIETFDIKPSYFFELTPDWGMEAGYIFRERNAEIAGKTNSNEIFLSIRRSFSYQY